ncbi:hypothetical protein J6590_004724 [Homalodisca vitripennis]|nr:hypothetical protein J6590_004724 [Homalodisca vitripennis]
MCGRRGRDVREYNTRGRDAFRSAQHRFQAYESLSSGIDLNYSKSCLSTCLSLLLFLVSLRIMRINQLCWAGGAVMRSTKFGLDNLDILVNKDTNTELMLKETPLRLALSIQAAAFDWNGICERPQYSHHRDSLYITNGYPPRGGPELLADRLGSAVTTGITLCVTL